MPTGPGKITSAGSGKTFPAGREKSHWRNYDATDGLVSGTVMASLQDREGNLWFGTWGGGASRYDGQEWQTFTAADGLASNNVWHIFQDREGNLWFTSGWGDEVEPKGVSRYDGQTWKVFTEADGLASNAVAAILQDREGSLWFGTVGGGASRYDGQKWKTFTTADGLAGNKVFTILQDREGSLWFGTWDGGASRYDGEQFVSFTAADGLAHNNVHSMLEDRVGNLWFGSDGGVSRYDGKEFTTFTVADGLGCSVVGFMLQDREGNLWFGTWNGGVCRYDGEKFTTFTTRDGLAYNNVLGILEDRAGHLWFGTYGGGISCFDGLVFQTLSRKDGLPSDMVQKLIQAHDGDIWIATEGGVARYRPQRTPPKVRLTEVIADRRYDPAEEIRLAVSQQFVHFKFQGRSMTTRPEGMAYVYRLEGYEAEWKPVYARQVEYQDLPLGEYTFQVKAVDRDLNYSEVAEVRLKVVPDPRDARIDELEQRVRERTRELEEKNRALEQANVQIQEANQHKSQFLSRMSHDLRTPMNAILGYTRILLRKAKDALDERQYHNLENIQLSAARLLSLINDILDLSRIEAGRIDLKPEPVDLGEVVAQCAAAVESLLKPGVELKQELADLAPLHTDADRLNRVLMNLLSNAVKFTEAGRITIAAKSADGVIELSVADTGIGIPGEDLPHIFEEFRQSGRRGEGEKQGSGLGLAIAKKSVELLGGSIAVESLVGKGTKFSLRLRGYGG